MIPLLLTEYTTNLITLIMHFTCMHDYLQSNMFQVTSYSVFGYYEENEKQILPGLNVT